MNFDDSSNPSKILTVEQTKREAPRAPPTFERAQFAQASSDPPTPIVYWIEALNDLKTPINPLPPQYWSSYDDDLSPAQSILTYEWNQTVKLSSTSMVFFADQGPGSVISVAPPVSWKLEYRTSEDTWEAVSNTTAYPLEVTNTPADVEFEEVVTEAVRATLQASTDGTSTAGVGVIEWSVKSPDFWTSFYTVESAR